MSAIDWRTPLAAIVGDTAPIAGTVRTKVSVAGAAYDSAGQPDVLGSPAEQAAQLAALRAQLITLDKAAAAADGKPLTVISPTDPGASTAIVVARVKAAAATASGALAALLADMAAAAPPTLQRGAAYNASGPKKNGGRVPVGDIQIALIAALAELAAYVSIR